MIKLKLMGTVLIVIVIVTKFVIPKIWTTVKTVTSLLGFHLLL